MGALKLQNIENVLAAGSYKIGYLVWYDIRNATISPTDLKQLFTKHGLDDKYFPDDIKAKNAFQKAVKRAMAETGGADDRELSVKKIVDGVNALMYGIVEFGVDENRDLNGIKGVVEPEPSSRVWFDKNTLKVGWDKPHKITQRVEELYKELTENYVSRDIARMIGSTMDKLCCVSLRDAGVVYFVPVNLERELLALRGVVNDIGQCNMRTYALGNHDGNDMGVQESAKEQIGDTVTKMKKKIAKLRESIEGNRLKGQSAINSIEVKWRDYQELKEKCSILADCLKIKADDLTGDLAGVQDLIRSELEKPLHDIATEG